MKPRIFVSSTFYDLKYIREDLSNFISSHDFDPIMFEDGDIGYIQSKHIDESCYRAMETADMAIVIIGGNYGSPASGEKKIDQFNEFLSVTRREFETAIEKGIPLFVFIDKNVFSEYGVYVENKEEIESKTILIKFKATKNINIFRFIFEIEMLKNIVIIDFDKVVIIKDFLSKQWADMFKNYLSSIKEHKQIEQLQYSINNINLLIEKMGVMVDGVGKKVLTDSSKEYQDIKKYQVKAELKYICELIAQNINIEFKLVSILNSKSREDVINSLMKALQIASNARNDNEFKQMFFGIMSEETGCFRVRVNVNDELTESILTSTYFDSEDKSNELVKNLCQDIYFKQIFIY